MKKILSVLGAVGLTATTTTSVVACGKESTFKGDDLSNFQGSKWNLQKYNDRIDKHLISLWLDVKEIDQKNENKVKLSAKDWSLKIWLNILNADPTKEATEMYNQKNLSTVLHATGDFNSVISEFLKGKTIAVDEEDYVLEGAQAAKLGVTLDVDVISKTKDSKKGGDATKEYGLLASSMQFIKLGIKFVDATNKK